jgi:hypothetical protein
MTRQEWSNTCRRVSAERVKYLREQGYGSDRRKAPARSSN